MKEKVENALKEFENNFFYGQATIEPTEKWNYSVFRRHSIEQEVNTSKHIYQLAIVREDYIEENLIDNMIEAILKKTQLKLRDTNFKFDYLYNSKSSIVCEVITIDFYKSKKSCYNG